MEEYLKRFEGCVKKLIELEAMKAANYERISKGESLAYSEEQILKLL